MFRRFGGLLTVLIVAGGLAAALGQVEPSLETRVAEINARILANPKSGDNYNELGVLYLQHEEWALARDAFIRAVQAMPRFADYHRNLGVTFLQLQEYDLAGSEFEAYRDLSGGENADAWRLISRAREAAGDTTGALGALDEGLRIAGREPRPELMRLVLAKSRLLRGAAGRDALRTLLESYQPVARQLRRDAELAPDTTVEGLAEAETIEKTLVSLYIEDGRALENEGKPLQAAELYDKGYQLAPDRAELLPPLMNAFLAAGDTAQARAVAQRARRDHPQSPGTWIAIGKLEELEGRREAALEAYLKAFDEDQETPGLRSVIGNLYVTLGRSADGRKFLAPVVASPDAAPEVVYNYAVSLIMDKAFAEAVEPLRRVVQARPDFAPGWAALGQALRATERFADAIEPYQKALALAPDAKLAFNLGVCAQRAGRAEEAIAAFEQALTLDPGSIDARVNYGLALMGAQRYEEALAAFDLALEQEPKSYRVLLNQGVSLHKLGRFKEAIAKYNLALEQKLTPEAYDNMGLAYQALGDPEKAQTLFREARKLREK